MTKLLHELSRPADGSRLERRWFAGAGMELIAWFDDEEEVVGFQFCYEKQGRELAITWRRGKGFQHSAVDSGEQNPTRKKAPILAADEPFDAEYVSARFEAVGVDVPGPIAHLVAEKLRGYPRG